MKADEKDAEPILAPLRSHGFGFYLLVTSLAAVVGWGLYAFYLEFVYGLGVTGDNLPNAWGLNIVDFVYFIAISMAGTIVSGVLRLSNAGWRKPITRLAEAITVAALPIGALFPLLDLGRPERAFELFAFARLQSPITWDTIAIGTYFVASLIYFYLPLIPDLAVCRDALKGVSGLRRWLYTKLSLRWMSGNPDQEGRLQSGIKIMAVLIVPIAVAVHSVLSWVFSVTFRVELHSTIFPIFFVMGAVYSGIATILVVMYVFRRFYHLERFIEAKHFLYVACLFLATDLAMIYLTVSEYLTPAWASETQDMQYLSSITTGAYSPYFWFMMLGGFIIPAVIVALPRARKRIGLLVVAALLADAGMWVERYLIVIPSLAVPELPYFSPGAFTPSWEDLSITAAGFAGFALLLLLISKVVPVVSVWELSGEGATPAGTTAGGFVRSHGEKGGAHLSKNGRREFLSSGLFMAAGMAAGLASLGLEGLVSPLPQEVPGSEGQAKVPLSSLGDRVTVDEAAARASFSPLFVPKSLPAGSSFKESRLTSDGDMATLLYRNDSLTPVQFYDEPVGVAIYQRKEDVINSPPSFLPQGFDRFAVNGNQAFTRQPSEGGQEPGQLQWWSEGRRISVFANLDVSELAKIASSMEAITDA